MNLTALLEIRMNMSIQKKLIVIIILDTVAASFCNEKTTHTIRKAMKRLFMIMRTSSQKLTTIPYPL
jgi:hypothetical protein